MSLSRMITSRNSSMPLYEHLQRSIQYALDRLGPHGLPLIGRADWNDCLNLNCFSDSARGKFSNHHQQGWQCGGECIHCQSCS